MAIQASHLTFQPSQQQILSTRNVMNSDQQNTYIYNPQLVGATPGMMLENQIPLTQCGPAQMFINPHGGGGGSGVANNLVNVTRKRPRDSTNFLYEFALQLQQQESEIKSIIEQHTKKIRLDIGMKQREQQDLLLSIGKSVVIKMDEKDEQIQRMGKINLFLQEKVKNLMTENQIWKNIAQANEATATTLQRNLEQVLAQVSVEKFTGVDDVSSCCGSTCPGMEEKMANVRTLAAAVVGGGSGGGDGRMCRKCGGRESGVLLLPCRHLCLCTVCGTTLIHSCPVCNVSTNATVHVNMS